MVIPIWWLASARQRTLWQGVETRIARLGAPAITMFRFDRRDYRLGYGAGYYDRTLASLVPRPLTIGVTYSTALIPTIHPLAHDIPIDRVMCGVMTPSSQPSTARRQRPRQCRECVFRAIVTGDFAKA